MITTQDVLEVLKKVKYPNFEKDIVSFGFVKNITINADVLGLRIEIPAANEEIAKTLDKEIKAALAVLKIAKINLDIVAPKESKPEAKPVVKKNLLPDVKNFIMVSSGKGGVGKSTTAVNLAIGLAQTGLKVGLLDADIYGPNLPRMLGQIGAKVELDESGKRVKPIKAYGIKMMSIGIIYEEGASLIWRGPMVMRAIEQMLSDVIWGDLDVLVIDMPPGTGDAQLTLSQSVPVTLGITVTTPQKVSLDDGARSLDMFKKMDIKIAGIVENMSGFVCPNCNSETDIFDKGTTEELASKFSTTILEKIPLEPAIREGGDSGKPVVYFAPNSVSAKRYKELCLKISKMLNQ